MLTYFALLINAAFICRCHSRNIGWLWVWKELYCSWWSETTSKNSYWRKTLQVLILWSEFHWVWKNEKAWVSSHWREAVSLYSVWREFQRCINSQLSSVILEKSHLTVISVIIFFISSSQLRYWSGVKGHLENHPVRLLLKDCREYEYKEYSKLWLGSKEQCWG